MVKFFGGDFIIEKRRSVCFHDSLCDIVFGFLVWVFMNDETRSSPLPDDDSSVFTSRNSSLTKLNQGDDSLLATLRLAAGACLSSTERRVAL